MPKTLVTGASGFIGKALCQRLNEMGREVVELSSQHGDISDPGALPQVVDIEHVFHLAGRTFVPDSWNEPLDFHRANVLGTLNVLELCREREIPLTYVSAYLYGVPEILPIKEEDKLEPNNPYALSKVMAEDACRFYAKHLGIPVTIIRPFNIYGPGQKAHFLIPEIVRQVLANKIIHLKDLAPRRDYLYIDDLIEALVRTIKIKRGLHLYNIGSGKSLSVGEIVETIQRVAGTSLEVVSDEMPRRNEIPDVYADIKRAMCELDWTPRISFEEGVRMLFDCKGSYVDE